MNDQMDQQQQNPQDAQAEAEKKAAMNKAKDRAMSHIRYRLPYPIRIIYDIVEPLFSVFRKKK